MKSECKPWGFSPLKNGIRGIAIYKLVEVQRNFLLKFLDDYENDKRKFSGTFNGTEMRQLKQKIRICTYREKDLPLFAKIQLEYERTI